MKKHFNIDNKTIYKTFKASPTILKRNQLLLLALTKKLSSEFQLDEENVKKAFIKQPNLFNLSFETLSKKIKTLAKEFKISEQEIGMAFFKSPGLLELTPEHIFEHTKETALLFQTDTKTIIQSFLKAPTLFSCSPNTLKQKLDFYHQMYLEDVFRLKDETDKNLQNLTSYLLKSPNETLANSFESLKLRRLYGLWLKEKTGFSQMSPIWKRINKITQELETAPSSFLNNSPDSKILLSKIQKEK